MSWIEKLSNRIAKKITPVDATFTVGQVSHGLELFIFNVGNTMILLIIASFLKCFIEVLAITSILIFTRTITGGTHLKSPIACFGIGSFLIVSSAYLVNFLLSLDSHISALLVLAFSLFAYLINFRHAPAEHIFAKYDNNIKKKSKKTILFFLIISCFICEFLVYSNYKNLAFSFGFAVLLQSALLHPMTFLFVRFLETKLMREG